LAELAIDPKPSRKQTNDTKAITEPTAELTPDLKPTTENISNLKLTTKLTPFTNLQPFIELITDPKLTREPTVGQNSTIELTTDELLIVRFGSVVSFIVSFGQGAGLWSVYDCRKYCGLFKYQRSVMWSVLTRRLVIWSVWDWWSVRKIIGQFYGWLLINGHFCGLFWVDGQLCSRYSNRFRLLPVLLMVWNGWSALSLFHLVNFAWIYYFSLGSLYSKTGSLIFLRIRQKQICLDWWSLCWNFSTMS